MIVEPIYLDHNGVGACSYVPVHHPMYGHRYQVEAPDGRTLAVLNFQEGPVPANGVNGVTNETLIAVLIHRLEVLNAKVACEENTQAIFYLHEALSALESRTKQRMARGVEGHEKE